MTLLSRDVLDVDGLEVDVSEGVLKNGDEIRLVRLDLDTKEDSEGTEVAEDELEFSVVKIPTAELMLELEPLEIEEDADDGNEIADVDGT